MEEPYDDVANRIENTETDSIILDIAEEETQFSLTFIKSSESTLTQGDLNSLTEEITTISNL